MAGPEKSNSSMGKDKGKMSEQDEDISKDFLTSWKSMSMTDGDDMDFSFVPVTKGNKKAFDFGKFDMDFSLDGEFGKLSSFKIDMPDLDFSSSPKKSTKSKEKSEDESVKGNRPTNKNEFSFDFDFNGLDDFNLDAPSTKGGNKTSREKSNKEVGSMIKIDCDLTRQAVEDNGAPEDTTSKKPSPECGDTPIKRSEDLVNAEGNLDASPGKCPSNSEKAVEIIQPKRAQVSSDKLLVADAQPRVHQSCPMEETSNKSYVQATDHDCDSFPDSGSTSIAVPVESANTHVPTETKTSMSSQVSDKAVEPMQKNSELLYAGLNVNDTPAVPSLVKISSHDTCSEEVDVISANRTSNHPPSEVCTATGALPVVAVLASDTETVKPEQSSKQLFTDIICTTDEQNELTGGAASSCNGLPLNILEPSAPSAPEIVSSAPNNHADASQSGVKLSSAPSGSVAKPILTSFKVPRSNDSKFSLLKETNCGGRTKLPTLARNREDLTQCIANDRREENGKKLDDTLSLSTRGLVSQESASDITEKNVDSEDASMDSFEKVNGNFRNGMGINTSSQDGQPVKDALGLPGNGTKIHDAKSSSFQGISSVSGKPENNFGNIGHGKIKGKILYSESIAKSNVSGSNKLDSLKLGKKLPGLASLKMPGNKTTIKRSPGPDIQNNAKSMVNIERNPRFQATNNPVPPEKQRPSTPSLKRKPSQAAGVWSINMHPLKRLSPRENRVTNEISTAKAEDRVQTQSTLSEGSRKNGAAETLSPKFKFHPEVSMDELVCTLMPENDSNIEKAEACAKELEDICGMLKKKHEEAKDLLVRSLVNNNHLLMLNHPIYEEKIHALQRFASRLMSKELKPGV